MPGLNASTITVEAFVVGDAMRDRVRGSTVDRGYGRGHQQLREAYRPAVERGEAQCCEIVCLMSSRWIPAGAAWDLAHDRASGGYLGPAHRRCNRAEAARFVNGAGQQQLASWHSRRWFSTPSGSS